MKNNLEKAYYFMLTLLSILVFVIFIFALVSKQTYLSEKFWIKASDDTHLYQAITNDANTTIQDLGRGSGIQEDGLKDVFTQSEVKQDVISFMTQSFTGQPFDIDETKIKKQILNHVETYATDNNQPITDKNRDSITSFVNTAFSQYDRLIKNPIFSISGSRIRLIAPLMTKLIIGLGIIWVVLSVLLFIPLRKFPHIFKRWASYQFISSGLILGVISSYGLIKNPAAHLSLTKPYLLETFSYIYSRPLIYILIISALIFLIGIVLAVVSNTQRKQLIRKKNNALEDYHFKETSTSFIK